MVGVGERGGQPRVCGGNSETSTESEAGCRRFDDGYLGILFRVIAAAIPRDASAETRDPGTEPIAIGASDLMSRLTHLGRALGLGLGDLAAPLVEVIGGSVSHVNTGLVLGAGDGGHLAGALGAGAAKAAAAEVRARGKSTDGGHVGSGEGKCTRRSVNGECASEPPMSAEKCSRRRKVQRRVICLSSTDAIGDF